MINIDSDGASCTCSLVVTLKKLNLFRKKDDEKFWQDLTERMDRFKNSK